MSAPDRRLCRKRGRGSLGLLLEEGGQRRPRGPCAPTAPSTAGLQGRQDGGRGHRGLEKPRSPLICYSCEAFTSRAE